MLVIKWNCSLGSCTDLLKQVTGFMEICILGNKAIYSSPSAVLNSLFHKVFSMPPVKYCNKEARTPDF